MVSVHERHDRKMCGNGRGESSRILTSAVAKCELSTLRPLHWRLCLLDKTLGELHTRCGHGRREKNSQLCVISHAPPPPRQIMTMYRYLSNGKEGRMRLLRALNVKDESHYFILSSGLYSVLLIHRWTAIFRNDFLPPDDTTLSQCHTVDCTVS